MWNKQKLVLIILLCWYDLVNEFGKQNSQPSGQRKAKKHSQRSSKVSNERFHRNDLDLFFDLFGH